MLSEARERLSDAKKMIAAGKSLARERVCDKACVGDSKTFGVWAEIWIHLM